MASRVSGRAAGVFLSLSLLSLPLALSCSREALRIGVPLVLTGVNSQLGVAARNGIQLAAAEINKAGGIRGRPIELIVRDDGDSPEGALAADQALVEAGAVALVGHMTSKTGLKAIPWANERGLLILSPTISSSDWNGQDDYFIRVIGSNEQQGKALAAEALKRGYRRAWIIVEEANAAFTMPVARSFAQDFAAGGGSSGPFRTFRSAQDFDYRILAREALGSGADLLLSSASAFDNALICQELAKSGSSLPLFGPMWSMTSNLFVQGGRAVEGSVFAGTLDPDSRAPSWLNFRSAYLAAYGEEPTFGALHGYEALMVLAQAAKEASSLDSAGIRAAILRKGSFTGVQGELVIDAMGDCSRPYLTFEARNGSYRVLGD